jgi:Flp pilus assembly protein TadD
MRLKPKTVRRLLLLSLVGVLLIGSAFSLFVVRRWQNQRLLASHRAEGMAAFEAGDYFTALDKVSYYHRHGRMVDPEVLLAIAVSRQRIEEPDNRHLVLALRPYQLYLEQKPDDAEARMTLLKLYNQAGYYIEARDLAARMRPSALADAGPEHLPVLREEALALMGARAMGTRLDGVLARIFELDPLDVDAHLVQLDVLAHADRRADARAWGKRILDAYPDQRRAHLVYAASRLISPSPEEISLARLHLCEAAGLDPGSARRTASAEFIDKRHARRLVALLDAVRTFDHSMQVLRDAVQQFEDVELKRLLVRRLWQDGEMQEVIAATDDVDPGVLASDAELLGLRAVALLETGRHGDAAAIATALGQRKGDFRAEGWSEVIPLLAPGRRGNEVQALTVLREAVKTHPNEPVFKVVLGDHLASLGRLEEARRAWNEAGVGPHGEAWAVPWMKIAESLLPEGRTEEAVAAANEALSIAPNRIMVNAVWFEAQAARIQKGARGSPEPPAVLDRLDRAMAQLESQEQALSSAMRERLLPCRIILLARSGRAGEAKSAALAALKGDLRPETLQRLAAISVSERLGFEQAIMEQARSEESASPGIVHARAMQLAAEGRAEEGLQLLREAGGPAPTLEAQIVIARYMDATGHADAPGEWRRIGEANPQSLIAQRACLGAQSLAADRDFVERTIQRYQQLQGKNGEGEDAEVRLARARALLHGRPTRRARDEAVGMLAAVVSAQPALAEARVLLASALMVSDPGLQIAPDLSRATTHLLEAARLEPRNAGIALELARLLQIQRDHRRAREHLLRVAEDPRFDTPARRRAAELLLAADDPVTARDVFLDLAGRLGDEAPAGLLVSLAEAHRRARQPEQARAIYERLAAGAADDVESILATAVYLAQREESQRAQQVLTRLDALNLSAGEQAYALGRFHAYAGDQEVAAEHFERALESLSGRSDVWRQYAGMYMRLGDPATASAIAARGLQDAPGDTALSVLLEQSKLLATGGDEPDLHPLIEALSGDAAFAETARLLRAIDQANRRGHLNTSDGLRRLADQFPNSAPLQMYVARRLAAIDPSAAVGIARRAMEINKDDPEPAKLAAELFLALGRWNDMLSAARMWRARQGAGSAEPDVAIAEAYWRLGRAASGLQALAPHLSHALATPEDPISLSVLNLNAHLLILTGREREAREVLRPLLAESAAVRLSIWMGAAVRDVPTLDASLEWLTEVERFIPAEAAEEHLAAAIARSMLAERFANSSDQLLGEALARLGTLVSTPELATAAAWEALGMVRTRMGDMTGAEEAYQQALEIDPSRPISLNNLANIAAQTRGDLAGALALAQRAVSASAAPDPAHVATLAAVHRELGNERNRAGDKTAAREQWLASAEAYGRLAQLRPADPGPAIQRAQALAAAGDHPGAAEQYERVLAMAALSREHGAVVKNNLAAALLAGPHTSADLERAVQLVHEALEVVKQAALYDTLGWVLVELDRYGEAEQAFRKALQHAAEEHQRVRSSELGLAYVLRRGDAAARQEAARLAQGLEGELEGEHQQRLHELRQELQR